MQTACLPPRLVGNTGRRRQAFASRALRNSRVSGGWREATLGDAICSTQTPWRIRSHTLAHMQSHSCMCLFTQTFLSSGKITHSATLFPIIENCTRCDRVIFSSECFFFRVLLLFIINKSTVQTQFQLFLYVGVFEKPLAEKHN